MKFKKEEIFKEDMIKLIIFDLDDCLIDTWNASFPITIKESIKAMVKKGLKVESLKKAINRLAEINTQSKNTSEAISKYLEEVGEDPKKYLEFGKRAVYDFNFEKLIKPNKGAIEALEKLISLEIDLALVTTGGEERQMKKMEISGIDKNKFKRIYAVSEYDKTEPYKKIMVELGHSPSQTLIVGDRYETDLIPGKNLGAKIAWIPRGRGKINPPEKNEVDYIIEDLYEIIKIVEK